MGTMTVGYERSMSDEFKIEFRGHLLIFDQEGLDLFRSKKWLVGTSNKRGAFYVMRNDGKQSARFHREFMGARKGQIVDHINGNRLDNRRVNLRFCTNAENVRNSKKYNAGANPYKGTNYLKARDQWRALIRVDGKQIFLGSFNNATEAAMAYDKAAGEYFGEFARLNFPNAAER